MVVQAVSERDDRCLPPFWRETRRGDRRMFVHEFYMGQMNAAAAVFFFTCTKYRQPSLAW